MDGLPSLRDVACFVQVARELSFSRAATMLRLSQPAVSQAVARLEREVGADLFERSSRRVGLSALGSALLPHADQLLAEATDFIDRARSLLPSRATIRLAYPSLLGAFVARVVRRLGHRDPDIAVELRSAGRRDALTGLAAGEVSAAIIDGPFPTGVASIPLFGITVGHLALPANDPLATLDRVRLDQVRRPILLPRHRPPGGMWARLATLLPRARQIRIVTDEIDDFGSALDLVAAGQGLLPTPDLLTATTRRNDVRFVPLDGAKLRLTYGLIWAGQPPTADLLTLVQTVQETLRTR